MHVVCVSACSLFKNSFACWAVSDGLGDRGEVGMSRHEICLCVAAPDRTDGTGRDVGACCGCPAQSYLVAMFTAGNGNGCRQSTCCL